MRTFGRGLFLLVMLLLWCAAIFIGGTLSVGLVPQIDSAQRFVAATGVVTHSDVITTQHRSRKGRITHRHRPDIQYSYAVAGVTYTGSSFTLGDEKTRDLPLVNALLREHPVGAVIPIHHDPDRPSTSCIRPGLHAGGTTPLFFVLPIVILLSWGTHAAVAGLRRGDRPRWLVDDDGELAQLRGNVLSPWLVALIIAGVLSIAGVILSQAVIPAFDPPTLPLTLIGAAVAASCAGFWLRRASVVSGRLDVYLDRTNRELTLPASIAGDGPREVRFNEIDSIDVLRTERRGSKGQRIITFTPRFHRHGGTPLLARLFAGTEAHTTQFGTWVAAELGARFGGVVDESADAAAEAEAEAEAGSEGDGDGD